MIDNSRKQISIWLTAAFALIFIMVIVGGITRLTKSGLSMVEWHPISGAIPPTTDIEWEEEFEKYKQYPEYKKINSNMTLSQFKFIFFWEYIHRLIGRLLGIFFIIPFCWFLFKKMLNPPLIKNLLFMFFLGGLQGLFGWYMVKSGLVDTPQVSHYRLAVHLSLAFGLLSYILWVLLKINQKHIQFSIKETKNSLKPIMNWILVILILQIIYGAFTAGLKAGYGWNTFPKMAGQWIPKGLFSISPWYLNLTENNFTVQFIHRMLGWILSMVIPGFWSYSQKFNLSDQHKKALDWILYALIIQFLLGISTLIMVVPVWLGVMHQAGAVVLLTLAVYNRYLVD